MQNYAGLQLVVMCGPLDVIDQHGSPSRALGKRMLSSMEAAPLNPSIFYLSVDIRGPARHSSAVGRRGCGRVIKMDRGDVILGLVPLSADEGSGRWVSQ